MGTVNVTNTSTAQMVGSSKPNPKKPSQVKALEYLSLFPLLDRANKTKLVAITKMMGMDPKKYPLKKDMLVAIKLALHCKAGIIKHTRELKIVGKNMQIVEIRKIKTKKEICQVLDKKMSRFSLRKIQKLL